MGAIKDAVVVGQQPGMTKEQQKLITERLSELNSKLYDKASTYANLITVAGYAGAFAIWSTTRAALPLRANIVIALLLGVSLVTFIFFEVFKMAITAISLNGQRQVVASKSWSPTEFASELQKLTLQEAALNRALMRVWFVILFVTVSTALAAIFLLFYNYVAILLEWPFWPK